MQKDGLRIASDLLPEPEPVAIKGSAYYLAPSKTFPQDPVIRHSFLFCGVFSMYETNTIQRPCAPASRSNCGVLVGDPLFL